MSEFDEETSKLLIHHFQKGGWMPVSEDVLRDWLVTLIEEEKGGQRTSLPVIEEFRRFIENDGEMYMAFHRMFEGARNPPITYQDLLRLLNRVIQEAPSYGPIGPPIYMIIAQAMDTSGGFTAFLSSRLNRQFKSMFGVWSAFLSSPASRGTLNNNPGGWFSPDAMRAMVQAYPSLTFERIFECNPQDPHWGFRSWDHFFCRTYRPGIRLVEGANEPNFINAACESTTYKLVHGANNRDTFWLKSEPYSLIHMLNNDPDYGSSFVGGTVFQGFLSVTGYHRWHSPVTGTIRKIVQVEGTYFAQSPATLAEPPPRPPLPPYLRSLAFITSITTRALIFIESANPLIGLMCFIAIGMTEVSTCEVTVRVGQSITRGDELGMFHFGGSSHVLIFGPRTNIMFDERYRNTGSPVPARAAIAAVR